MQTTPRSSWVPFVLMALVVTVALASSATPSPLYVDYQQSWEVGGTTITVVYAVYALAVLVPLLFLAFGLVRWQWRKQKRAKISL